MSIFKTKISPNAIVKASLGIFIITFLVKGTGYIEKLVLAYHFGTSPEVDVYNVVSATILSVFVFFREIVEPGFLNSFLTAQNNNDNKAAWNIFNLFGRIILVATLAATILVEVFPEGVIGFFAPGFDGSKKEMAIEIIKIAFPAAIFLALSSLTNITLNAFKNFVFPATGDLLFRVATVLFLLVLTPFIGIYSAAIGLLVGAGVKLLVHLSKLHKNISLKKVVLPKAERNNIIRLTWPLLLGVSFSQFNTIVDNIFASFLENGALSALSYSKKIVELPILIFPYLLSTVLFPFFSQSYIKGEATKTYALLTATLKWITIAFIPLSIFFLLYASPIVSLIFQRGAFDEASTVLTTKPFMIYSVGMLFFAIETIIVIYYFANGNTLFPILVGIGCVVLNIAITYFTIGTLGYSSIPLAYVISKSLKVSILLLVVFSRNGVRVSNVLLFLSKVFISALLFYFAHLVINNYFIYDYSSIAMKAIHLAATCLVTFGLYIYVVYRLRAVNAFVIRNSL